jgi:hypothetical protein
LADALVKVLNHHIYEYPTLTEAQIIGCLMSSVLNYFNHDLTENIREVILEVLSEATDGDDEEEDEEDE